MTWNRIHTRFIVLHTLLLKLSYFFVALHRNYVQSGSEPAQRAHDRERVMVSPSLQIHVSFGRGQQAWYTGLRARTETLNVRKRR